MGSIISKSPAMMQPKGDSAKQDTNVGGGSRPTKSMYPIETSAPMDAHTQGRAPAGWLK